MSQFKSRSVDQKILSTEHSGHAGRDRTPSRIALGVGKLKNFDPFIVLDQFVTSKGGGFPDHPHRGFETVTYLLPDSEGSLTHEDFCGHKGLIRPGGLQWMTAGRGIVHSEMPLGDGIVRGLQLWINLSSENKMIEPKYQELEASEIPRATKDGVTAIVIAGEALGVQSHVRTLTPAHYVHFLMEPHSQLQHHVGYRLFKICLIFSVQIASDQVAFVYILKGVAQFGPDDTLHSEHHTITLTNEPEANGITVRTTDQSVSFVLIAGKPLNQPIAQHGPFVMNTQSEIQQAFKDYREGKNGFENALVWTSTNGLAI